jgi:hypothetical protein
MIGEEGGIGTRPRQLASSGGLFSFADENPKQLAGAFFQASLLPYLLFLYFLAFSTNRLPWIGTFGFQYLLLFVIMTIVAGILAKSNYDVSLADSDWLHGLSESLLTVSNLLIVFGLNEAMTTIEAPSKKLSCLAAVGYAGICFVFVGAGVSAFSYEKHSQLLGGFGNLGPSWTLRLPWVKHVEPKNALSIPTWIVHFSSVFEYIFAMNLIWRFARYTGNTRWKGLTWAMVPLHASSICAVTHHFFYNAPELLFLVSTQGLLTLLGNTTCMIASYRIARSNGWSLRHLFDPCGYQRQYNNTWEPLTLSENGSTSGRLAFKLLILVVACAYVVKYGELGFDLPFNPNEATALAFVIGIPGITTIHYGVLSISNGEAENSDDVECDEETPLKSEQGKR